MLEVRPHLPLADLLRAAELARSSFYYQLKALRTGNKHCDLKAKIREIFNRHKGRYGYRRVTAELRQQGLIVNHKTVQKLMVEMQLSKAYDGAASETAPDAWSATSRLVSPTKSG